MQVPFLNSTLKLMLKCHDYFLALIPEQHAQLMTHPTALLLSLLLCFVQLGGAV